MIGITGASGVLGKILCEKLKNQKLQFSNFKGDIRDYIALNEWVRNNGVAHIIHLASKVAVKEVEENIDSAYDINVSGTINVIKVLKNNPKTINLFYASSSHVYKSSSDSIKETDELEPINSYGLTKYISELLLLDFKKKNLDINICIGRIFSFYHFSQKPPFLYPNLIERFKNEDLNRPFKLYGANSTRDFLNAEEVCDIIIQLVKINYNGVVNIASGKSSKIIDFVKSIAPCELDFELMDSENITHLNADVSLLKKILQYE
jgi:nucleoside-diphosphate-sugar epimerase